MQHEPTQPLSGESVHATFWRQVRARWDWASQGIHRWWDRGIWPRVALVGALLMLGVCACCSGVVAFALSPVGQELAREGAAISTSEARSTAQAQATAAEYALLHPTPTPTDTATAAPTNTPTPTDTATAVPTNTPAPIPSDTPAPIPSDTPAPIPTDTPCPDPCNPWGYNFSPGNLIYNPPGDFCSWFNCIPSFWTYTNGYVEECVDATFSHSGGVSGSCSHHGGNWRPLYSH